MSFLKKLTGSESHLSTSRSFTLRLLVIGFLILIFFFPTYLVQGLIYERAGRQSAAVREVSSKWGESQTVAGPLLVVPYYPPGAVAKYKDKGPLDPGPLHQAYFVPAQLKINGNVRSQVRARGIYQVTLYEGELELGGHFSAPDLAAVNLTSDKILWDRAYLVVGGLDLGGLKSQIVGSWDGGAIQFGGGLPSKLFTAAVSAPVRLAPESGKHQFTLTLNLRGSGNLFFVPVGKATSVKLASDWASPSFDGAFLPTTHTVTANGFTAEWQIFDLNRGLPDSWTDPQTAAFSSAISPGPYVALPPYPPFGSPGGPGALPSELGEFGVKFYLPVDIYQKTTRSAKYALAVIGLVFLIFFLIEATANRRVNPLQYILIGLALCIFYTLLLSLSEYIAFGEAYLIASAAIVGMVGLFTKSILKSWRLGLMAASLLVVLYGFVYLLLQSKDYTLLVGSIGLFIMLAIIMYFSRYVNWYGEGPAETNNL